MANELDANRIAPKLWQGSYPRVRIHGSFKAVALCAKEHQRPLHHEPGLVVITAPMDDAVLTRREWVMANRAADKVAELVSHGQRTLVTCHQGRNRSGLVSALVLYRLTTLSGAACALEVQRARRGALTNPSFVAALESLPTRIPVLAC